MTDLLEQVRAIVGTPSDMALLLAQLERHGEYQARMVLDLLAREAYPAHAFPLVHLRKA